MNYRVARRCLPPRQQPDPAVGGQTTEYNSAHQAASSSFCGLISPHGHLYLRLCLPIAPHGLRITNGFQRSPQPGRFLLGRCQGPVAVHQHGHHDGSPFSLVQPCPQAVVYCARFPYREAHDQAVRMVTAALPEGCSREAREHCEDEGDPHGVVRVGWCQGWPKGCRIRPAM